MTKRRPTKRAPDPAQSAIPDYIEDNLRRMFGAVAAEPLPDRLKELLRRLADADKGGA